jgi:hypothetical protein
MIIQAFHRQFVAGILELVDENFDHNKATGYIILLII